MTASKMWTFMRILPIVCGINSQKTTSEYYKTFTLLAKIFLLLTKEDFSEEEVVNIEDFTILQIL
jgi:hypothetical protein